MWDLIHNDKSIAKVFCSNYEYKAIEQLKQLSERPDYKYIVAFPDLHAGEYPVGYVMRTGNTIYFDLTGADIGCNVRVVKIAEDITDLIDTIAIINLFKRNECPVLAIRDTHTKNSPELNTLPDHCILYSWGYQIYEDIDNAIKQADHVYGYKNSFDGSKTIFHHLSELRPIKKIFLIGVAYDICVFFTAAGLTKGWPAEDIHIIRNATMNFNNDWAVTATEMLNTLYGIQPVTLSIINSV